MKAIHIIGYEQAVVYRCACTRTETRRASRPGEAGWYLSQRCRSIPPGAGHLPLWRCFSARLSPGMNGLVKWLSWCRCQGFSGRRAGNQSVRHWLRRVRSYASRDWIISVPTGLRLGCSTGMARTPNISLCPIPMPTTFTIFLTRKGRWWSRSRWGNGSAGGLGSVPATGWASSVRGRLELSAAHMARLHGAEQVVVFGRKPIKLELARQMGADEAISLEGAAH